MKNLISGRRAIGKAYLSDNLGLPEILFTNKEFGLFKSIYKVQ
jgi:hypothetical protein